MKSEWKVKKIGDVVDIRRGASPRPIHKFLSNKGMPWVKIADATSDNSRFIRKTNECIINEGIKKSVMVTPETLIVSNSATPGLPKIMKINACVHDGWLVFSNYKGITRDFLYYKFIDVRRNLVNQANGSVFQNLKTDIVREFDINIPSINTQNKIVSMLSKIDEKIELNEKINKNLQLQAQILFIAWFETFEPFDGVVPDSWKQITLGDIAEIKTNSFNPQKNPDVLIEHYSIPAFDENKYPVFEYSSGVKSNKYILSNNSVMISKLNPDTKRVWRPLCLSDFAVSSTEFIIFEPYNPKYKDYVYSIIDSQGFTDWMCSHTTGSTNSRQRTTPATTLNYNLWMPDDESIKKFLNAVTPMYDLISQNLCQNQELVSLRDSLLPKLMSGELDVSNIDI